MDVHLLGTAGYHPNEQRHTACMMIPEAGLVFDAGTAFFRVRDLAQTPDLHLFLTHCHLDHCVGLSFFIDTMHETVVENIYVYGLPEKLAAVRQHLFSEHLFPVNPPFHWIEIAAGQKLDVALGGKLKTFPLKHPGGSLGIRVDWPDHTLAYVTDTTADLQADYVDEIRGVDLLLHECHFPDGLETLAADSGHSCLTPVAQVSRAADAQLTVLVHINPLATDDPPLDLDSVKSINENILLGQDKMVVKL
ncbi:MAG: MBL fold metallo-hydrolase [Pirellulaceae bacterium]